MEAELFWLCCELLTVILERTGKNRPSIVCTQILADPYNCQIPKLWFLFRSQIVPSQFISSSLEKWLSLEEIWQDLGWN